MSRTPDPKAKISLLRAAEEVFAEKGLEAAKVQDITERAGMSKGSFYLHFESKEEAFRQVVESFLARCMTICGATITNMPSDPVEMLVHWGGNDREAMEFFWQNRGIVRILPTCQGEHMYLLEAFHEAMEKNCIAWIENNKKVRLMREDLNSTIAASIISGTWHELMHKMMASTQKPPFDEWLRQARSVVVRGMGTPVMVAALESIERASAPAPQKPTRRLMNQPVIDRARRRVARA